MNSYFALRLYSNLSSTFYICSYYINYLTKAMQLEDPRIRYRQLQNEHTSMESIPMQTQVKYTVSMIMICLCIILIGSILLCLLLSNAQHILPN